MFRLTAQLFATMGILATSTAFTPLAFHSRPTSSSQLSVAFMQRSPITSQTRLFEAPMSTVSESEVEAKTAETEKVEVTDAHQTTDAQNVTPVPPKAASTAPKPMKAPAPKNNHKQGVLSPVVLFMKDVMGDENLNKFRGKVISVHSNVIGSFVDTSESAFGDAALRALFRLADKNNDGTISKEELQAALQSLGFKWLQEKQAQGIFQRADADGNGRIDMDEWIQEAPKTLRTNLIKLAKKNGGDMGLLS